jgi:hypothetical protein
MAMVGFISIPGLLVHLPDWVFILWILLVLLLCFSTLFFAAQRIWRAPTRMNRKQRHE